jgi:hypothetical protein
MKIRLGELRRVIRGVLQEDRESFLSASEPIVKGKGPSAPRDVKRLWNAEADHGFFAGLTKVHWVRRYLDLRFFDKGGSRDEVSVGLYLPGQKLSPASAWMEPGVGVVLQGRVTLASNDMGSIWTGYADEAQPQHTKTSGAVRRGTMMNMSALEDYIDGQRGGVGQLASGGDSPDGCWCVQPGCSKIRQEPRGLRKGVQGDKRRGPEHEAAGLGRAVRGVVS